jgi:hypothetical protein
MSSVKEQMLEIVQAQSELTPPHPLLNLPLKLGNTGRAYQQASAPFIESHTRQAIGQKG